MSYADVSTYFENKGTILGSFEHKETGAFFEYSVNDEQIIHEGFNEFVWVNDVIGWPKRYAKVLKTVAYVITDEDEFGNPVIEKWPIKNHRIYKNWKEN